MIGSMREGLQEIRLVLKSVVDLLFKVLKARDEVVESSCCVWMVQHTAGWYLEPAVTQVTGLMLGMNLHRCSSWCSVHQW